MIYNFKIKKKMVKYIQVFLQMINNPVKNSQTKSNQIKNNQMELIHNQEKMQNIYKKFKNFVLNVINQNAQCFVLEYVEEHTIKSVMNNYLIMKMK